jgi:hypothetical protein
VTVARPVSTVACTEAAVTVVVGVVPDWKRMPPGALVRVAVAVAVAVGVTVAVDEAARGGAGEPTAGALAGGNGVPNSWAWAGAGAISHHRHRSVRPAPPATRRPLGSLTARPASL